MRCLNNEVNFKPCKLSSSQDPVVGYVQNLTLCTKPVCCQIIERRISMINGNQCYIIRILKVISISKWWGDGIIGSKERNLSNSTKSCHKTENSDLTGVRSLSEEYFLHTCLYRQEIVYPRELKVKILQSFLNV